MELIFDERQADDEADGQFYPLVSRQSITDITKMVESMTGGSILDSDSSSSEEDNELVGSVSSQRVSPRHPKHRYGSSTPNISVPNNCTLADLLREIVDADQLSRLSEHARYNLNIHSMHFADQGTEFNEYTELVRRFRHAVQAGDTCITLDYPNNVEPSPQLLDALENLGRLPNKAFPNRRLAVTRRQLRPDGCTHKAFERCVGTCVTGAHRRVQLSISWSDYLHATTISPRQF